jgi:phosphoribosyl 1,2-cyclic phosphodiesterase
MILEVLGSSSLGNSYLLRGDNEILVVEAGAKLSRVKEALNFDISKIAAVLVSHLHNDHSGYIRDYLEAGMTILSSRETFESKDLSKFSYLFKEVIPGRGYKIGQFKILPFELSHDVPCLGFHINHPESGNILFITDSFMCPYTFPNLNHIMLEVNYADDILDQKVLSGQLHPAVRPRLLMTHMSLETAKGLLKANDLSQVNNIILLHLSAGNSDEERFVREIRQATGKQVYAAHKGLKLALNINPY